MHSNEQVRGWLFGIGAFVFWGLAPIYFKALTSVSADEILAHRILWCTPFTLLFIWALKKPLNFTAIIKQKKLFLGLVLTTSLVSVNWYIFTWAVTHDHILDTSLGYFINPIFSILLGVIFLHERLTVLQWGAVVFATLGVTNQIVNHGEFPWISLSLATTFAIYGFIRKQLHVDSLNGLLVETTIAMPFALAYIIWLFVSQQNAFTTQSLSIDILLLSGGIITAVPLIWFASSAKIIPLNSVGFLQFIAPSMSFVLATAYYNEPLGKDQLISFIFIWCGLALYMVKPIKTMISKGNARRKQPA
ncbi:MAG: EamA family transporter RarD [Gammaproteobacteria bacterium]|nr:EamA family transporter RarD [Gammaproteobacteria bacterium]MDH5629456.1 EamA family transporter RarD [Gammaproteobacteria bacterium]